MAIFTLSFFRWYNSKVSINERVLNELVLIKIRKIFFV